MTTIDELDVISKIRGEVRGDTVPTGENLFLAWWKIQSELTPRANVSLTPENFLILTP